MAEVCVSSSFLLYGLPFCILGSFVGSRRLAPEHSLPFGCDRLTAFSQSHVVVLLNNLGLDMGIIIITIINTGLALLCPHAVISLVSLDVILYSYLYCFKIKLFSLCLVLLSVTD